MMHVRRLSHFGVCALIIYSSFLSCELHVTFMSQCYFQLIGKQRCCLLCKNVSNVSCLCFRLGVHLLHEPARAQSQHDGGSIVVCRASRSRADCDCNRAGCRSHIISHDGLPLAGHEATQRHPVRGRCATLHHTPHACCMLTEFCAIVAGK
jgi:hypothetical protein